jgi:hypothetical protein
VPKIRYELKYAAKNLDGTEITPPLEDMLRIARKNEEAVGKPWMLNR